MFQRHNHRYVNQKVYNNNASGSLIFFSGAVVVGLFVLIVYVAFEAFNAWSQAVDRTWTPANNDTLVSYVGGAFMAASILGIVLLALTILPFIIRLWAVQINALNQMPRRDRDDEWKVIDSDALPVNDSFLLDDPGASVKLLPDSMHMPLAKYIDNQEGADLY